MHEEHLLAFSLLILFPFISLLLPSKSFGGLLNYFSTYQKDFFTKTERHSDYRAFYIKYYADKQLSKTAIFMWIYVDWSRINCDYIEQEVIYPSWMSIWNVENNFNKMLKPVWKSRLFGLLAAIVKEGTAIFKRLNRRLDCHENNEIWIAFRFFSHM